MASADLNSLRSVRVASHVVRKIRRRPLPPRKINFRIGVIIAGLISVFMPSRDERLISAARGEVLSRLANPASAVFAEVSVEEERIRSWSTSVVQGCVKSRKPSDQFPTWQGFSVEGIM